MVCFNCKANLEQQGNFCRKCGARVRPDGALVQRAVNGDQQAAEQLYYMSVNVVSFSIRGIITHDDELVQDTYVKAFRRLEQLREPEKFIGWVKEIGRNTTKDWLKAHPAAEYSLRADAEPELYGEDLREEVLRQAGTADSPEVQIERSENARLLGEILNELSPEQRMTIQMFYFEEMPLAQVAEQLELPVGTVKSRLNAAKKKIEKKVSELEQRGTKIYGLSPVGFLLLLLRNGENSFRAADPGTMLARIQNGLQSSAAGTVGGSKAGAVSGAASTDAATQTGASAAAWNPGAAAAASGAAKTGTAAVGAAATAAGVGAGLTAGKIAALVLVGAIAVGGVGAAGVKLAHRTESSEPAAVETETVASESSEPAAAETETAASETPSETPVPEVLTGTLIAWLADINGAPAVNCTVAVTDAQGARITTLTSGESGSIEVELEPGTYTLTLESEDYTADPVTVEIAAGETVLSHDFILTAAAEQTVTEEPVTYSVDTDSIYGAYLQGEDYYPEYAILDLNGDGIDELIVTDHTSSTLFTVDPNTCQMVAVGGEDSIGDYDSWNSNSGEVCCYTSGAGIHAESYMKIAGRELVTTISVFTEGNTGIYTVTLEDGSSYTTNEAEADVLLSEHKNGCVNIEYKTR